MFVCLIMSVLISAGAGAEPEGAAGIGLLRLQIELSDRMADRIRARILEPILGPNQGFAFVDLDADLQRQDERSSRDGLGLAMRRAEKCASQDDGTGEDIFKGFGFDTDKWPDCPPAAPPAGTEEKARPDKCAGSVRKQASQQRKSIDDDRLTARLLYRTLRLIIIHNKHASPEKLAAVRAALLAAFPKVSAQDGISFHPAPWHSP